MLLLSSLVSFAISAGGLAFAGPGLTPSVTEGLVVLGALSAFATICSAEAALSS